jgi:hypothetical protein
MQRKSTTFKFIIGIAFPLVFNNVVSAQPKSEPNLTERWLINKALQQSENPSEGKIRLRPFTETRAQDLLKAKLTLDRNEACPGEGLHLQAEVVNMSDVELKIPWSSGYPLLHLELHIVTPAGAEFMNRPYASLEKYLSDRDFQMVIHPRKSAWLLWGRASSLDLVEKADGWSQKHLDKSIPLSFRKEGQYRLWYEVSLPYFKDAPQNAWSGSTRSNEIRFTVRELPVDQRLKEPTREQVSDLNEYVELSHLDEQVKDPKENLALLNERYERIEKALQLTKNEGLALEVIRLLKDRVAEENLTWYQNLLFALVQRVHETNRSRPLRIDGPYLGELTAFFLRRLEQASMSEGSLPKVDINTVLFYLKSHPEDKAQRNQALQLAKKYARPANLIRWPDQGAAYHHRAHGLLTFAWGVLIATGILREGMSLEEAVTILGLPTTVNGNKHTDCTVDWYYGSTMHVNPCLRCTVKEGFIERIEIISL